MNCIACGREGHRSSNCPLQLWRWAAPEQAAAPVPQPAQRAIRPASTACRLDSHDRTREAWLQFA